MSELQVLL